MEYLLADSDLLRLLAPFVGGILSGLYASSVGSGGLITLPILILIGLPIHIVIGTNRFGVVFLELAAAIRFRKQIKLNAFLGLCLGVLAALGGYIGSKIILNIEVEYLNTIIAFAMVLVLCILLLNRRTGMQVHAKQNKRHMIVLALGTLALGIYGGSFGVGFGTFIMMLIVTTGYSYLNAAALSRVIGSIMSITSAVTFAYYGVIDYPLGISLGIGCALGGWIGAGISVKRGNSYIRTLFFIVIMASVVKLIV